MLNTHTENNTFSKDSLIFLNALVAQILIITKAIMMVAMYYTRISRNSFTTTKQLSRLWTEIT
jgi:hypothetical protein